MSRCSEQKQQMKWEPLPLPVGDESLCFSTTENHPPLEQGDEWCKFFPSTVRKTTPPSSLMPPRWCLGWGKDNSPYPIQSELSMANYKAFTVFTHIFAHPWRLSKDRRLLSPAPDHTVAAVATLTLASHGFGEHFSRSLRSLCPQSDVDTDRDGAMDSLPRSRLGASDASGSVWAGSRKNVSYGVNLLKTPCLQEMCCLFVIVLFSPPPPLPKLQDRAMPVKSLLKDVRSSNEYNKATAEATALTRPLLREVRHRYVKLFNHE